MFVFSVTCIHGATCYKCLLIFQLFPSLELPFHQAPVKNVPVLHLLPRGRTTSGSRASPLSVTRTARWWVQFCCQKFLPHSAWVTTSSGQWPDFNAFVSLFLSKQGYKYTVEPGQCCGTCKAAACVVTLGDNITHVLHVITSALLHFWGTLLVLPFFPLLVFAHVYLLHLFSY